MIKVFINGMGTIGRAIYRLIQNDSEFNEIRVDAINDVNVNAEELAYLLNYDSAGGGFRDGVYQTVSTTEDMITCAGKTIRLHKEKNAANLPLGEYGIDVAIDCTGTITKQEDAGKFLDAGARLVLVCNPTDGKLCVYGINQNAFQVTPSMKSGAILSLASCTTQAASFLLKILHDSFCVTSAFVRAVHAYTADQGLTDGADHDYPERGRAAAQNIVPTVTSAAKSIGAVIPELNGYVYGQAFRVPTLSGGAVDITCILDKEVDLDTITGALKGAANNSEYGELIYVTNEPLVSSDAVGDTRPVKILLSQTSYMPKNNVVNVVGIYDNVVGFSAQALRTVKYMVNSAARSLYAMYSSAVPLSLDGENKIVPFEDFDWRAYADALKEAENEES